MSHRLVVVFMLSFLLFPAVIAGYTSSGEPDAGKAVYIKKCKMCHGADGQGNPAMARMLQVEFKAMDSPEVQKLKDDEIKEMIAKGKGKMAKVRGVSDQEIADVIAYLRSLKK
jgi:mono/diheme cytochrome c family protein